MNAPTTPTLFPQGTPEVRNEDMPLDTLPSDTMLLGRDPSRAFVDSVKAFGVLQPVIVMWSGGTYSTPVVVDGRRRIKAAREAGLTTIPTRVFPEGWMLHEVVALVTNEQRSENLAVDLDSIENLLRQGFTEDEIAQAVGMPKTVLRSRLKLLGLTSGLRQGFLEGTISGTVASKAARLPSGKQRELEVVLQEKGRLTEHDVREVTQVRSLEAVAALPDVMFGTPSVNTDWRTEVAALVERALQATPTDRNEAWSSYIRAHLQGALDYLVREGGEASTDAA